MDTNPLSDMLFANIFSHSTGCLLVLLIVSFTVQKIFILMRSQKFIFAFVSLASGDVLRSCCGQDQGGFACFLLENFDGFLSYIEVFHPFWVYFCVWCKKMVQVHFSSCCCPVFPAPFAEEIVLIPLNILSCFVKD